MNGRNVRVAGSTGAVGKTLVQVADARGIPVVPLVRARHQGAGGATHPRALIVNYEDVESVTRGLRGGQTVLQLIGTMRKRFNTGDTYETSDIGTTRTLVEASRRAGIDHFVLLSSVGAGKPFGAYLKAKARAEQLVLDSGLPFTILRPSAFMGAGHQIPSVFDWATRKLGARRYQPIKVEDLVDALLETGVQHTFVNRVLEGEALWELVAAAKRRLASAAVPAQ